MPKYKVVILEKHVVDVKADNAFEAEGKAEWAHDDANGSYYTNNWINSVKEINKSDNA